MTEILGFIGFLVIIVIAFPATLIAFIKVIRQPVVEIVQLWITLADLLFDLYESIKNGIKELK